VATFTEEFTAIAQKGKLVGLLRLEAVRKGFRRGREEVLALDGVDLDIEPGGFVALVGPSGSGKSTLLHLAGGLDKPDEGKVFLEDRDLSTLSAGDRARRRHLGLYSRARNHKQISRCSLTPLTLRPVFPTSAACSDQWGEAFIAGLKRRSPGVWVTTGASPASMLAFAGPAP